MLNKEITELFKNGSKTYFNSSRFFPEQTRDEVTILYAFVRKADNFVDDMPQDPQGFYEFVENFQKARNGNKTNDIVINEFAKLEKSVGFDPSWADSFLKAMEQDLHKQEYEKIEETEAYIYGSANVIGLFMSKIMRLDEASYYNAEHLGKAMQFINFIRDIDEDINELNRNYFPQEDLRKFGLKDLKLKTAQNNPDGFKKFIKKQLDRYKEWQTIAEEGYKYIPKKYLVPIKTAADKYNWTAAQIEADPFVIYKKKVKPSKLRIILTGVKNWVWG